VLHRSVRAVRMIMLCVGLHPGPRGRYRAGVLEWSNYEA
jgi:hypothetical protein